MIVKTILALLITVIFAGGAVYYGTQYADMPANEPVVVEEQEPEKYLDKFIKKEPELVPEPVAEPAPEPIPELEIDIDQLRVIGLAVMAQADKMSSDDLKDQAYLDIVNYAVKHEFSEIADVAMTKIKQIELRDTARSQIAIALALQGRSQEAFDVIDQVEIDALRDVMRLQVIEALIVPDRLHPSLRGQ